MLLLNFRSVRKSWNQWRWQLIFTSILFLTLSNQFSNHKAVGADTQPEVNPVAENAVPEKPKVDLNAGNDTTSAPVQPVVIWHFEDGKESAAGPRAPIYAGFSENNHAGVSTGISPLVVFTKDGAKVGQLPVFGEATIMSREIPPAPIACGA